MIRSAESLSLFLDLIADGVSASEASVAVGAAPGSKIAHIWKKESSEAAANNFEAPPDASEPYAVIRGDGVDPIWFHQAYEIARADGRATRSIRKTPLRSDLQAKLHAKRAEPPKPPNYVPPKVFIGTPADEPTDPVARDLPAPPKVRPPYAYKSKPLDASNRTPPTEGRFTVVSSRPTSVRERMAGTVELTDQGVKRW